MSLLSFFLPSFLLFAVSFLLSFIFASLSSIFLSLLILSFLPFLLYFSFSPTFCFFTLTILSACLPFPSSLNRSARTSNSPPPNKAASEQIQSLDHWVAP
jgi:hypothetical protein